MKSYGGAKALNAAGVKFARLRRNKLLREVSFCSTYLLKRNPCFLLKKCAILRGHTTK